MADGASALTAPVQVASEVVEQQTQEGVQNPPVETPNTEEKKPETQKEQPTRRESKAFAALARQRKAIEARESSIKAQMAELEKRMAEVQSFHSKKENARKDPLGVLGELGLSIDDLAQHIENGGKPTPDAIARSVEERLAAFEKRQAEASRTAQEQAEAQKKQAVEKQLTEWRTNLIDFVSQNSSQFELTNAFDAQSEVPKVIEETYNKTGKLLSKEEAAGLVEKHLESVVEKILATKKVSAKAKPQASEAGAATQAKTPAATTPVKTLTSELHSASRSPRAPETEKERLERAVAAYYEVANRAAK